ncbi:MAG: response regulator transcription factor [Anaerolineae bacterium]|nr:response regulator transcription factor [Anaerolineae bacterium]
MYTESPIQMITAFPGARILVVDDERNLRTTLTELFNRVGYRSFAAASGVEALRYLVNPEQIFDVVLLDLKMPGMAGTEVLERAREQTPETIYIIMTAYGTLESAITGIRNGAYDYLLKPSPIKTIFQTVEESLVRREEQRRRLQTDNPIQLLERALANLKQTSTPPAAAEPENPPRFLTAPGIVIDTQRHLVLVEGDPVHLTVTEFELLIYFMQNQNRALSLSELAHQLRGYEIDEQEASTLLRSHVHRLREKLHDRAAGHPFIRTVRGKGYCFMPPSAPVH